MATDKQILDSLQSRYKLFSTLPDKIKPAQKAKLMGLIDKSIESSKAGNVAGAKKTISQFKSLLKKSVGARQKSIWLDCGEHCEHHLDEGNHKQYGTCYWACIIRGGPRRPPIPR